MRRLLALVLLSLALPIADARAATAWRTVTSARCACSFRVPKDWIVHETYPAPVPPSRSRRARVRCSIGLEPPEWQAFRDRSDIAYPPHAIAIEVLDNVDFDAAARVTLFERRTGTNDDGTPSVLPPPPSGWVVTGRQGAALNADAIQANGWHGLYGIGTPGYHGKQGGYRGIGEAAEALVHRGRRGATFFGEAQGVAVTKAIVMSFRFTSDVVPRDPFDWHTYESVRCGVTLAAPPGWKIVANPKRETLPARDGPLLRRCAFAIRRSADSAEITLALLDADQAAAKAAMHLTTLGEIRKRVHATNVPFDGSQPDDELTMETPNGGYWPVEAIDNDDGATGFLSAHPVHGSAAEVVDAFQSRGGRTMRFFAADAKLADGVRELAKRIRFQ
jgi:hypothetical protein